MAKAKSIYACTECGATSSKWQGQCPGCNAWNTLVETIAESDTPSSRRFAALAGTSQIQTLSEIEAREEDRLPTGVGEFDRALGGGLVAGGVVLIGGDPGIGKSTLLLQALTALSVSAPVLYVSGEESGQQIALRARRLAQFETTFDADPQLAALTTDLIEEVAQLRQQLRRLNARLGLAD